MSSIDVKQWLEVSGGMYRKDWCGTIGTGRENKVSNGYHSRQYTGEDIYIEP